MFSVRHEFPTEWHRFLHPAGAAGDQTMTLALGPDRFPFLFNGRAIAVERIEVFVKVRPEHAASHDATTIRLTLRGGHHRADLGRAPSDDVLASAPWNGLLRGERAFGQAPGSWTINGWLDDGGGPARLDPDALQEVLLVCHYTVA